MHPASAVQAIVELLQDVSFPPDQRCNRACTVAEELLTELDPPNQPQLVDEPAETTPLHAATPIPMQTVGAPTLVSWQPGRPDAPGMWVEVTELRGDGSFVRAIIVEQFSPNMLTWRGGTDRSFRGSVESLTGQFYLGPFAEVPIR